MSKTQTFSILPCPHTGLARWLTHSYAHPHGGWRLHRADRPALGRVIDLYLASELRRGFGD